MITQRFTGYGGVKVRPPPTQRGEDWIWWQGAKSVALVRLRDTPGAQKWGHSPWTLTEQLNRTWRRATKRMLEQLRQAFTEDYVGFQQDRPGDADKRMAR